MTKPLTIYVYPACSTCKKAVAYLREKSIPFETVDISQRSPSKEELRAMIERRGGIRPLFNTSGQRYREGRFSEKVASMSVDEAVEVLSRDGMLVKRPFLISARHALIGFNPDEWDALRRA